MRYLYEIYENRIFGLGYQEIKKALGRACSCVAFLLSSGPVLFFVGLGLLVASKTDFRGPKILKYNQAVREWNSTYSAQFAALSVQIQLSGLNRSNMELVFLSRALQDHAKDGEFIESYDTAPVFRFSSVAQLSRAQFVTKPFPSPFS